MSQQSFILGASEMTFRVKVLAVETWRPDFNHQNLYKGVRKEMTLQNCPLECITALWHIYYAHKTIINSYNKHF